MNSKDMANLYWFCQAVESGGFAAASLQTQVSAATISRAVAQLEQQLGEKLLHRNAKQFQLTLAGEEYHQRFSVIFEQLGEQWQQLNNSQPRLTGDIYVSCPEPFADYFLQQLAIKFMQQHPDVNIHIRFASDTERFIEDQIDLAVVTTPTTTAHLVQRRLFESTLALAASPEYIKQHGQPQQVEELLQHQLLAGNTMPHWKLKMHDQSFTVPIKPKYSVNSLRLTIQAAKAGVGICLLPQAALTVFAERGELVPVLPQVQCPSGSAYIVWVDRKLLSARVAAFRDSIFEHMQHPDEFLVSITR
ncbi:LysR family transcriptional regulator [Shewanella saliphila]|uniref:LysR family transcriptional regulator n=1 Tax=Shewanella saliphila TaxID=2282698 RepID=A0ABQ2Q916_9GAMM|nr:LysR family transcriptional regulator [Shewanella saliphila]MCL1100912.1 LysR family transcriptional regulator [Shewanella saliphila]GGP57773.1 LysR family transcriptional regulator [Shewanella saliphila]